MGIQPGQAFHLPAAQQKNFNNLLKIFSKKEATEALTALAKTKPSTWVDFNESIGMLNRFIELGGGLAFGETIGRTIKLQIESVLSPLTNEINQMIITAFIPINELLNTIVNELTTFIASNPAGSTIGGVLGGIASLFLPGGPILVAIGALIGAAIEALFGWLSTLLAGTLPDPFVPAGNVVGAPIVDPNLQVAVLRYFGGDAAAMFAAFRNSGYSNFYEWLQMLADSGVLDEFY